MFAFVYMELPLMQVLKADFDGSNRDYCLNDISFASNGESRLVPFSLYHSREIGYCNFFFPQKFVAQ